MYVYLLEVLLFFLTTAVLCCLYMVYMVHLTGEPMLYSFNVNCSHSANLASHFVDRALGSCVLMSAVMVLGYDSVWYVHYDLSVCLLSYSKAQ